MELKELRDKHKGQMAFIVCAGPSLHHENVELMKDYVTFAVNSSVLKIPFCDYFVSDDEGVARWNYYMEDLRHMNCLCLLYEKKSSYSIDITSWPGRMREEGDVCARCREAGRRWECGGRDAALPCPTVPGDGNPA